MPSRWTVTVRTTDNLPANFVSNQFCTSGPGGDPDDIRDALAAFYDELRADLFPLGISQTGHIVKGYDLPGTPPNYPFYESTFDLGAAPSGDALPSEVAICLSYQAPRVPGEFQARKRGRVYLGPCKETIVSVGRPNTTVRNGLLDAAENLYDAIAAITDAGELAVWSTVDGVAYPVTEAWVDDAFDTQRSRGLQVTTKTVRDLT